MKIIDPNNEILKFIKERVIEGGYFKKLKKNEYNLNLILENKARDEISIVQLIIECEEKYNVDIDDYDVWNNISTPLNLYLTIQKKVNEKKINYV